MTYSLQGGYQGSLLKCLMGDWEMEIINWSRGGLTGCRGRKKHDDENN